MTRSITVFPGVVLAVAGASRATAATLQPATVAAWKAYVAATERRIAGELESRPGFLATDFRPDGPRIREGDPRRPGPGRDRGFLWRMNSYWRYQEVPQGVIVEFESLTLSRNIPLGLGAVVQPIIDGVASESMTRTLADLRRTYANRPVTAVEVHQ